MPPLTPTTRPCAPAPAPQAAMAPCPTTTAPRRRTALLQVAAALWLAATCAVPAASSSSGALAADLPPAHRQHLSTVSVDNHRVTDLLGPVLNHNFDLPSDALARGLVKSGANARLRRVVEALITGRTHVEIGVVGGSICCESAGDGVGGGWQVPRCACRRHVTAHAVLCCGRGGAGLGPEALAVGNVPEGMLPVDGP